MSSTVLRSVYFSSIHQNVVLHVPRIAIREYVYGNGRNIVKGLSNHQYLNGQYHRGIMTLVHPTALAEGPMLTETTRKKDRIKSDQRVCATGTTDEKDTQFREGKPVLSQTRSEDVELHIIGGEPNVLEGDDAETHKKHVGHIPFMITRLKREQLYVLGYKNADISTMTPAMAITLVDEEITREEFDQWKLQHPDTVSKENSTSTMTDSSKVPQSVRDEQQS